MDSGLLLVIAFVATVVSEVVLLSKSGSKYGAGGIQMVGFTVVAFLGDFSALVVSSPNNASAVFGLLGAVAGFLVGKGAPGKDN
ncbi:MAG: hypothetical protein IPK27_06375 [Rhodanobacteraceae bacterium]|nr:hypothetical protein [Rhodanobacteraceae bacterium]